MVLEAIWELDRNGRGLAGKSTSREITAHTHVGPPLGEGRRAEPCSVPGMGQFTVTVKVVVGAGVTAGVPVPVTVNV